MMQLPSPYRIAHYIERGNFVLSMHHHDFWQFIYVVSGKLTITFEDGESLLGGGQLCIIRPLVLHELSSTEGYCQLGVDMLDGDREQGVLAQVAGAFTGEHPVLRLPNPPVRFGSIYAKMRKLTTLDSYVVANLAERLILHAVESASDAGNLPFIERFLDMVSAEDACNLSLHEMCRKMQVSKTHLERLVKEEFDCGAVEYCNKIKISRACTLLQNTDLTIKSIGDSLNFYDESHFNSFFKKRMGITPGHYRRASRTKP